jgi:hypothetical protein
MKSPTILTIFWDAELTLSVRFEISSLLLLESFLAFFRVQMMNKI